MPGNVGNTKSNISRSPVNSMNTGGPAKNAPKSPVGGDKRPQYAAQKVIGKPVPNNSRFQQPQTGRNQPNVNKTAGPAKPVPPSPTPFKTQVSKVIQKWPSVSKSVTSINKQGGGAKTMNAPFDGSSITSAKVPSSPEKEYSDSSLFLPKVEISEASDHEISEISRSKMPFMPFEPHEIAMLQKRFKKLDSDNNGKLTLDEFMSISALQTNPLVSRVIDIFDHNNDGVIDFAEFVHGMSLFSSPADRLAKLRFAFNIYDVDGDGFISNGELFQVLHVMVDDNLEATELQQIVDKAIIYADTDEDGKVSFMEFCHMVNDIGCDQKQILN